MKLICRASFCLCLFCLPVAGVWSADESALRVAAIIASGNTSMVLVEDSAGKQNWHQVGDFVEDSRVEHIDPDWIRLGTPDGQIRLYLRGDKYEEGTAQAMQTVEQPPREVSRNYRFINLISRVDSAAPGARAVTDQASARSLNEIFGLAERAKITAINRVAVASVAQARAELRTQLLQNEPIRIAVDNAYTRVLYVMPEQ